MLRKVKETGALIHVEIFLHSFLKERKKGHYRKKRCLGCYETRYEVIEKKSRQCILFKKVKAGLKNLIFNCTVRAPKQEALLLLAYHVSNHDDTNISSHVKDKNSIFTAHDEDIFFLVKGKILVFHQ